MGWHAEHVQQLLQRCCTLNPSKFLIVGVHIVGGTFYSGALLVVFEGS